MDGNTTIVWFRRDLRIEDNPALAAAARDGKVCPTFIWCPKEEGQFYPGRVSRWWLKQSLVHLGHSLKALGAELTLIKTDSTLSSLLDCVNSTGATRVVFNHLYAWTSDHVGQGYHEVSYTQCTEFILNMSVTLRSNIFLDPVSLLRDHNIKEKLLEHGISVQSYNGDLLNEPWEVYDERGEAFMTFDSYWEKCLQSQTEPVSCLPPWRLTPALGDVKKCAVEELDLENETERPSNSLLGRAWSPGWGNADKALSEFVEHHLVNYTKNRFRVGGNSTSLLSPYLHFGEVSVRKVFHGVRIKQLIWVKEENIEAEDSVNLFLRSLGLRDYSRYLCFNFPFTHERSLLSHLKYFPWNPDQAYFKAWRQGRTGYPLVDAGMRELWATGWIHNRIRVIVSSFAVKFLLLPWRWGMKYFWDTLLDADLECDILGWQYISGSLPDGHELQRLDNPEIQGSKFDPEGEYVRQWLPELARMPTEWIHHPWDAPLTVLKAAGVELGLNYPKPIIDVDLARERLQEAIFKMWEIEGAAKGSSSSGTNETIYNAIETSEHFAKTKTALKEKASCFTTSSNDQKVPTYSSAKNPPVSKKRTRLMKEERSQHDQFHEQKNIAGTSKTNEELSSTADSSGNKKQANSRCSFSVPQYSLVDQECESSELKQPWQVQVDEPQ